MTIGYRDRFRSEALSSFHPKAQSFAKAPRKALFFATLREILLVTRPEQAAEDALYADLAGWNCEWLKL